MNHPFREQDEAAAARVQALEEEIASVKLELEYARSLVPTPPVSTLAIASVLSAVLFLLLTGGAALEVHFPRRPHRTPER